jgi:hypothetical protein
MPMKPCTSCTRHIRADERSCPFCGLSFAHACRDVSAFGLALFLAASVACTEGKDTSAGDTASDATTMNITSASSQVTNPTNGDNAAVSYYAGPSDSWTTTDWTTIDRDTDHDSTTTTNTTTDTTTETTTDGTTTDGTTTDDTTDGPTTDDTTDDTTDTN